MSQQRISRLLKNKDWMGAREIAIFLNIAESTVCENLRRMHKHNETLRKTEFLKQGGRRYLWKLK